MATGRDFVFVNSDSYYEEDTAYTKDELDSTDNSGPNESGAFLIGADPANISQSTNTTVQEILEDLSTAIADADDQGISYTVGTGGVSIGDLCYVSGNDTVNKLDIDDAEYGIGIAASTEAAAGTVKVLANDEVVEGVLTALTPTAGDKVFWTFDGSTGGLSLPLT
jgi:hypothetical protein